MGAEKVPIVDPSALTKTASALTKAKEGGAPVRILHLGDSHVAGDYITGTVRQGLQEVLGDPGRGFIAIDQKVGYGGRNKSSDAGFEKDRIVDTNRAGRPFGFSGESLESKKKGAKAVWQLWPGEDLLKVYYHAKPDGNTARILLDGQEVAKLDTKADAAKSTIASFDLPAPKKPGKKPRDLSIVADGPGVRLYGLSFEKKDKPGVFYDTIGPVGADAKVYLELDPTSFKEHLEAHDPVLVVLMVGGNDAMKIRKTWTDLNKVRADHERLLDLLKKNLPNAECLVWSPMDAGEKKGKAISSLAFLKEVREMQREVAKQKGCAFWDLYGSMGGEGSIAKWVDAKVMNADLVHPREKAAELLGELFLEPFLEAVQIEGSK